MKRRIYMKRLVNTIYICLLAIATGTLVGCKDDELVKTGKEVVEGVPVTATLKLSGSPTADIVVNARADNSLSEMKDLTIFIFDENGTFQQTVSTESNNENDKLTLGTPTTLSGGIAYEVKFKTTSGKKKMLAVGDMISSHWYAENNITIMRNANNGDYSFDELKNVIFEISHLTADQHKDMYYQPIYMASEDQMLLSGWNENLVIATDGTVSDWGDEGDETNEVGVKLERSMARIRFDIKNPKKANGTFIPSSYMVYNIPQKSYLTNSGNQKKTTPVESNSFIHYTNTYIQSASNGIYTFEFFMPENIYTDVTGITSYKDRDEWYGENLSHADKQWQNAPQTSTFVVISGTYNGNATVAGSTNQAVVSADVEYTIHLGDFSNDNWGNFSIERNCNYTYKVQVVGVDKIIVEALKKDGDKQQGAEGQVYDLTNTEYSYNLDAHYEQVFLEYNLSAIARSLPKNLDNAALDAAIADQLVLVIQSEFMDHNADGVVNKRGSLKPYEIYMNAAENAADQDAAKKAILDGNNSGGYTPTKGFDYKWIEFWPQTGTDIAEYPGISDWAKEDLNGLQNEDFYGDKSNSNTENRAYLMDVYDVIVEMGKKVKSIYQSTNLTLGDEKNRKAGEILIYRNENDYVARFTAFVNEYFYVRHPLTGAKVDVWSVLTNKIPREMIIAMSTNTSTDGKSSYSKVHSYISQLSMQTFYNSRIPSLNAFGIETYNETPVNPNLGGIDFGTPRSKEGLTDNDGRINQKILIGYDGTTTLDWSSFISTTNNGWTNSKNTVTDHAQHKLDVSAYNTATRGAYAACLSRNRDLNGNGRIDENEIRWFLASVTGYIRMGIGSNAISNAAQLYIGDKSTMEYSGYATNYILDGSLFYTSSADAKRLYWAVERGSFGVDNRTWTGGNTPKPIRCIRTLPAHIEGKQDISSLGTHSDPLFEDFAATGNTPIVLKFKDRVIDQLFRNRTDGSLSKHNENSISSNSFYEGIFVAKENLPKQYPLAQIIGYENNEMLNPCATYSERGYTGWRVPNLVELLAMNNSDKVTLSDGTICCTQFSNLDIRYGFQKTSDNGISYINCLGGGGASIANINGFNGYIRCVRDVPSGYFDSNTGGE